MFKNSIWVLIILIYFWLYLPQMNSESYTLYFQTGNIRDLLLDDDTLLQAHSTGYTLKTSFFNAVQGNYFPVTSLFHRLDVILGNKSSLTPLQFGFLMNLFFHLLNALLFYTLIEKLGFSETLQKTGFCLFLFHPFSVEVICWWSAKNILISSFFTLISLLIWLRYIKIPTKKTYCSFWFCYIMVILSRPNFWPVIGFVFAIHYFVEQKIIRQLSFYLISGILIFSTLIMYLHTLNTFEKRLSITCNEYNIMDIKNIRGKAGNVPLDYYSLNDTVKPFFSKDKESKGYNFNSLTNHLSSKISLYTGMFITLLSEGTFPLHRSIFWYYFYSDFNANKMLYGLFLFLSFWGIIKLKKSDSKVFSQVISCVFWCWVISFPNLIAALSGIRSFFSDRYFYLFIPGVIILTLIGLNYLEKRGGKKGVLLIASGMLVVYIILIPVKQVPFQSSYNWYNEYLFVNPNISQSYLKLAEIMIIRGYYKNAVDLLELYLKKWSDCQYGHLYLGLTHLKFGDYDKANINFDKALKLNYGLKKYSPGEYLQTLDYKKKK